MTKNFNLSEFECKGSCKDCGDDCEMPQEVYDNIVKLAQQLQILRDYIGKPININSAYRSPEHNARVGGSKKSQHLLGKASDITIKNYKPTEVYKIIEGLIDDGEMLQGGLGLYDTFVHYDIRRTKARWDYRKK